MSRDPVTGQFLSMALTADAVLRRATDRTGDCWFWTGAINPRTGYGSRTFEGKSWLAHRLAYVTYVGPIPHGMQLDHLCRVRHCVNPAHLEPVTARENSLRGETFAARNVAKTHCPAGHEYDEANTHWKGTRRACSTGAAGAAYQRRKTAERKAS